MNDYYDENSKQFVENTIDIDMNELYSHFLKYLKKGATILDAGCGTGRDAKNFIDKGYNISAFDYSERMVKVASDLTGQQVKQMSFLDLNDVDKYDGIWACASILHCKLNELDDVFKKFHKSLKTRGIIYGSFKYGDFEGMRNGRYFTCFTEDSFKILNERLGIFLIEKSWITNDLRPDREDEKWLNLILMKN